MVKEFHSVVAIVTQLIQVFVILDDLVVKFLAEYHGLCLLLVKIIISILLVPELMAPVLGQLFINNIDLVKDG